MTPNDIFSLVLGDSLEQVISIMFITGLFVCTKVVVWGLGWNTIEVQGQLVVDVPSPSTLFCTGFLTTIQDNHPPSYSSCDDRSDRAGFWDPTFDFGSEWGVE
jgi:hypothetical protein